MIDAEASVIQPKVVVAGRYKLFKREVDLIIEEFEDHNCLVLQPEKGGLLGKRDRSGGIYPLKSEKHKPSIIIENTFLSGISQADIFCIVNPDGSLGKSVSMELGYAYAKQSVNPHFLIMATQQFNLSGNSREDNFFGSIPIFTVPQGIEAYRKLLLMDYSMIEPEGIYVPDEYVKKEHSQ